MLYFLLQLQFAFDRELHALVMVVESLDLVSVLVMLFFSSFFLTVIDVFLLFVTVVVILVTLPGFEADPAELVSTATRVLLAHHVVAALVLFDVFVAVRTRFSVQKDPIYIFRF